MGEITSMLNAHHSDLGRSVDYDSTVDRINAFSSVHYRHLLFRQLAERCLRCGWEVVTADLIHRAAISDDLSALSGEPRAALAEELSMLADEAKQDPDKVFTSYTTPASIAIRLRGASDVWATVSPALLEPTAFHAAHQVLVTLVSLQEERSRLTRACQAPDATADTIKSALHQARGISNAFSWTLLMTDAFSSGLMTSETLAGLTFCDLSALPDDLVVAVHHVLGFATTQLAQLNPNTFLGTWSPAHVANLLQQYSARARSRHPQHATPDWTAQESDDASHQVALHLLQTVRNNNQRGYAVGERSA